MGITMYKAVGEDLSVLVIATCPEISDLVPALTTSLVSGSRGTLGGADVVVEAGVGLAGLGDRVVMVGRFGGTDLTSVAGTSASVGLVSGAAMAEIWVKGKNTGHFLED